MTITICSIQFHNRQGWYASYEDATYLSETRRGSRRAGEMVVEKTQSSVSGTSTLEDDDPRLLGSTPCEVTAHVRRLRLA